MDVSTLHINVHIAYNLVQINDVEQINSIN